MSNHMHMCCCDECYYIAVPCLCAGRSSEVLPDDDYVSGSDLIGWPDIPTPIVPCAVWEAYSPNIIDHGIFEFGTGGLGSFYEDTPICWTWWFQGIDCGEGADPLPDNFVLLDELPEYIEGTPGSDPFLISCSACDCYYVATYCGGGFDCKQPVVRCDVVDDYADQGVDPVVFRSCSNGPFGGSIIDCDLTCSVFGENCWYVSPTSAQYLIDDLPPGPDYIFFGGDGSGLLVIDDCGDCEVPLECPSNCDDCDEYLCITLSNLTDTTGQHTISGPITVPMRNTGGTCIWVDSVLSAQLPIFYPEECFLLNNVNLTLTCQAGSEDSWKLSGFISGAIYEPGPPSAESVTFGFQHVATVDSTCPAVSGYSVEGSAPAIIYDAGINVAYTDSTPCDPGEVAGCDVVGNTSGSFSFSGSMFAADMPGYCRCTLTGFSGTFTDPDDLCEDNISFTYGGGSGSCSTSVTSGGIVCDGNQVLAGGDLACGRDNFGICPCDYSYSAYISEFLIRSYTDDIGTVAAGTGECESASATPSNTCWTCRAFFVKCREGATAGSGDFRGDYQLVNFEASQFCTTTCADCNLDPDNFIANGTLTIS